MKSPRCENRVPIFHMSWNFFRFFFVFRALTGIPRCVNDNFWKGTCAAECVSAENRTVRGKKMVLTEVLKSGA